MCMYALYMRPNFGFDGALQLFQKDELYIYIHTDTDKQIYIYMQYFVCGVIH